MNFEVTLKGGIVIVRPSENSAISSFVDVQKRLDQLRNKLVITQLMLDEKPVAIDFFEKISNEKYFLNYFQEIGILDENYLLIKQEKEELTELEKKELTLQKRKSKIWREILIFVLITIFISLCLMTFGGYKLLAPLGWHDALLDIFPNFSKRFEVFYGHDPEVTSFKYIVSHAWTFPIYTGIALANFFIIRSDSVSVLFPKTYSKVSMFYCALFCISMFFLMIFAYLLQSSTRISNLGGLLYRSDFIGLSIWSYMVYGSILAFLMGVEILLRLLFSKQLYYKE